MDDARAPALASVLVVIGAAIGGAVASTSPSGFTVVDHALAAATAALLALAGGRAKAWSLFPLVTIGVAFGSVPIGTACGIVGLVAATAQLMDPRPRRLVGAVAGAFAAQAVLRLEVPGAFGFETLAGLAASMPLLVSAYRSLATRRQQRARRILLAVGSVSVVCAIGGIVSVALARPAIDRGISEIQDGLRAARAGDSEQAAASIAQASRSFRGAHDDLAAWWAAPAGALPILGPNFRAAVDAAGVAVEVTSVGADGLAETAAADLVIRKGRVPIEALARLEAPLLRVQGGLVDGLRVLDGRRSAWVLPPLRSRLDALTDRVESAQHDADVGLTAVRTLPAVFGAGGQRRYLALFVTPVEGRASGFPGNFAELTLTDGKVEMTRFGRVLELDRSRAPVQLSMPEEFNVRYQRFGTADSWRNVTMSPNFPTVAELVRQLYPQSGGAELDGVMSLDPSAIATLLRLTGPVSIPDIPRPISARNAEEFLLRDQYLEFDEGPDRVDALESLGRRTFDALLERDLPAPEEIARVLSPALREQHLRFVDFAPAAGGFFDDIGVTGALLPVAGDALAITTNNIIGNKVDLFLQRTVSYDVVWDPETRMVRSVLRIHLVNSAPASGLPDYVIGNALDVPDPPPLGTNRTFLSVFSPLGLDDVQLDGKPLPIEVQTEAGRKVYSTFLELGPGGEATVEMTLSGVIIGEEGYRLDIAPQVLALPDQLDVQVRDGNRTIISSAQHRVLGRESYTG